MDDRGALFSLVKPSDRPDLGTVAGSFDPARLTQARFAAGLSKAKLANLVGVTPAAIGQYESQSSTPRRDLLPLLARELHVPVSTSRPADRLVEWMGRRRTSGAYVRRLRGIVRRQSRLSSRCGS